MSWFSPKHSKQRVPNNEHANNLIKAKSSELKRHAIEPLETLRQAIENPADDLTQQIANTFSYTATLGQAIKQLDRLAQPAGNVTAVSSDRRRFVISSVTLQQAMQYLAAGDQERMVLVTGIEKDGTVTLTQALPVRMSKQSTTTVEADRYWTTKLLLDLDREDHVLWAMWHSHPGTGKGSTHASHTDLAHQDRWVKLGLPHMLGGITSSDGAWFRLFSTAEDFDVSIIGGDSITVVEDNPREKVFNLQPMEGINALLSSE